MSYRVAFDLDDTLLSPINEFPYEAFPAPWFVKLLGFEPIRESTVRLIRELRKQNVEVWIYTSSFRSTAYIRRLFWLYSIHLDGIVNAHIHLKALKHSKFKPSKYPPAFGINVLIDNSEGVKMEGEKYNFVVVHIQPLQKNWHKIVRDYMKVKFGIF